MGNLLENVWICKCEIIICCYICLKIEQTICFYLCPKMDALI